MTGTARPPAGGALGRWTRAAALLAAFALGLWLGGPARRGVAEWLDRQVAARAEAALSASLGARVHVDEAEIAGRRGVVLRGVRVTDVAGMPWLASLDIAEMRATVPEGEGVGGTWARIDSVEVLRPVATLRQPPPGPSAPAATAPRPPVRVGRVDVTRGRLVVPGEPLLVAGADGWLEDVGGAPRGELVVQAPRLPIGWLVGEAVGADAGQRIAGLLAATPCCGPTDATVELSPDGEVRFHASTLVPAGLPDPGEPPRRATCTAVIGSPARDGERGVSLRVDAPGLLRADVTGVVDRDTRRLAWSRVEAHGPRVPRAWLAEAVPEALRWGSADVRVRATRARAEAVDVDARVALDGLAIARSADAALALGPALLEVAAAVAGDGSVSGRAELLLAGRPALLAEGRLGPAAAGASPGVTGRDADVRWTLEAGWLTRGAADAHVALPGGAVVRRDAGAQGTLRCRSPAELVWTARVDDLRLDAPFGDGVLRIDLASARISGGPSELRLTAEGVADAAGAIRATWRGEVTAPAGAPRRWTARAEAELDDGRGRVRMEATSRGGPGGSLRAALESAQLRPWVEALAPDLAREARVTEAGLTAELHADVEATWDAHGAWRASADGAVSALAAQSADFSRALVVREAPWHAEATGEGGLFDLVLDAEAAGTQVLRGGAFADFGAMPPSMALTLVRDVSGLSGTVSVTVGPLGRAVASWTPLQHGTRLFVEIDAPDVAAAWLALEDSGALAGSPLLARLRPEGRGVLRVVGATRDGDLRLAGFAQARDVSVVDPDGVVAIAGLGVELPFTARRDGEGARWSLGPGDADGRLTAARLQALGARAADVDTRLVVRDGSVHADGTLPLQVLGGTLALDGLVLRDPAGKAPALEAGVTARGLQLARLGPVGPFRLEGVVSASFPRVRLAADALRIDGAARVLAWGGEISVRDLSVEQPLARFPRTQASVAFSEIDLLELTRTFGFGAMTGVVEGSIEDLELFGATPTRFAARLRSVERDGVPQSLDVPALQNLATLATGGRAPLFDKGLLRLVRTLRYDELGVGATLRADAFELRGLAERGGRELFLKGRMPLRVDVANAEPGAVVSFRAMMSRLAGLEGIGEAPSP